MKRELRARELQLLDGARQRFLQHQTQIKETELSRLDEEIARKVEYYNAYIISECTTMRTKSDSLFPM